jgi:hypothetical protein
LQCLRFIVHWKGMSKFRRRTLPWFVHCSFKLLCFQLSIHLIKFIDTPVLWGGVWKGFRKELREGSVGRVAGLSLAFFDGLDMLGCQLEGEWTFHMPFVISCSSAIFDVRRAAGWYLWISSHTPRCDLSEGGNKQIDKYSPWTFSSKKHEPRNARHL